MEDLPLGRIAALVPEFAVKDLPLGRTLMMIMMMWLLQYKGWMSNDNNSIFLTWLYLQGTTFMYIPYSRPPYLSSFAKCLELIVNHQRIHLC